MFEPFIDFHLLFSRVPAAVTESTFAEPGISADPRIIDAGRDLCCDVCHRRSNVRQRVYGKGPRQS